MSNGIKSDWLREGSRKKGGLKKPPAGPRPKPPKSYEIEEKVPETDEDAK